MALIATDVLIVALYGLVATKSRSAYLSAIVAVIVGIGLMLQFIGDSYPDATVLYQGFRKSLLWLMAIIIGMNVRSQDRAFVLSVMGWTLIVVCLYGAKQYFYFSEFDRALLSAQSSGEYANVIAGRQRAISVLSSGFHLGMAGCLLCAFALFSRELKWPIVIIVVSVAAFAVYASFTRTFMLILIAIILSRFILVSWSRAILALIAVPSILMGLGFVGIDVIAIAVDSALSDDRFTNRQLSYELFGYYMASDAFRWFLGFGPGSAGSTLGTSFYAVSAPWIEPHNIFLKYMFEYGVIVSGALFTCLAWTLSRVRSIPGKYEVGLAVSGVAILVISGLTITSVEATPISIYVGLVLGTMTGAAQKRSHDPEAR